MLQALDGAFGYAKPSHVVVVNKIVRDKGGDLNANWVRQHKPKQNEQEQPQGELEVALQGMCADVLNLALGMFL